MQAIRENPQTIGNQPRIYYSVRNMDGAPTVAATSNATLYYFVCFRRFRYVHECMLSHFNQWVAMPSSRGSRD